MLNDKEKRKGLPGANGLAYLIGGILIGGFGVLVVMFVLTKPSCACSPADPTPTFTLPYIPTPNPGATGTAAAAQAQTAEEQIRLYDFVLNEAKGQIGLIYGQLGGNTTIEVRAWSNEGIGDVANAALYSSTSGYSQLAFHPDLSSLIASNGRYRALFDIDDTRSPRKEAIPDMPLYSRDAQWVVGWSERQIKLLDNNTLEPLVQVAYDGFWAQDAAFSPDGTQVAVIGQDTEHSDRVHIEVYDLPHLTRASVYEMTNELGGFSAMVLMTPDRSVIGVLKGAIYVFDLDSSKERYFESFPYKARAALDASGRWLAVDGTNKAFTESALMIYDLQDTDHLAPEPPKSHLLPGVPPDEQFQFISDGLLVGRWDMTFTLYRWNGETWGDPKVVLTAEDLE